MSCAAVKETCMSYANNAIQMADKYVSQYVDKEAVMEKAVAHRDVAVAKFVEIMIQVIVVVYAYVMKAWEVACEKKMTERIPMDTVKEYYGIAESNFNEKVYDRLMSFDETYMMSTIRKIVDGVKKATETEEEPVCEKKDQ